MARNKFDVDEELESPFSLSHLKRSLVYVTKYKGKMIFAFVISIAGMIIGLIGPLLMQHAVDEAIPQKNIKLLLILSALLLVTIIVNIVFSVVKAMIIQKVGQYIIRDIRKDLFAHLQKMPFSYYDSRPHGKILVRVVQYVNAVSDLLSNGIVNSLIEILSVIVISGFMFAVNPALALTVIAGIPFFILTLFVVKKRQRRAWQNLSNKSSNLNAYMHENIQGMKVTQIFVREETNKGIFNNLTALLRKVWFKAVFIGFAVPSSGELLSQIVFSFVYICGIFWLPEMVSFGVILAMGAYVGRFWQPIINLANIYNQFINTISYLERIFETMDEPVLISDKENASELPDISGNIEFNDVTFSYEKGSPILSNISIGVKAGESIALVGPTGAGKTTVVNLLSRFYDIDSGEILIDGHNIADVTLSSLRSQMGIMLQDSFIFSGTVMDNIRYGKLDATDEEVEEASKTVCAHYFIKDMEQGYNTEVNERGSRLSQGQKQLISFARTLLSNPKILILDEATSSIDTQTEKLLQVGLNKLLKGRTSFIIAHRLSTIKNCDRIMYIADKGIAECGSHDELMELKGAYYRLYMSQVK